MYGCFTGTDHGYRGFHSRSQLPRSIQYEDSRGSECEVHNRIRTITLTDAKAEAAYDS